MQVLGTVVYTEMFHSRKTDKDYTKLFVPVSGGVAEVIVEGDLTPLAGVSDVPFKLVLRDGALKLYYDGEEE